MIQVWGLVGLATLSRLAHPSPITVDTDGSKPATRFAKALGLESIITGQLPTGPAEEGRTVKLTRIQCTQSFLHALLFETLRLAWAKRLPLYMLNVKPAVRSSLDLLESYALGG